MNDDDGGGSDGEEDAGTDTAETEGDEVTVVVDEVAVEAGENDED